MADKKMTVTLPFPLVSRPNGVEFQRYHEGSRVLVDSRIVPHLRLFEGADGQASLVLDGRFGVDGTEDEIRKWVCFVAHAMAVAAGYSCFGEQSAPMNPFKPGLSIGITATDTEG